MKMIKTDCMGAKHMNDKEFRDCYAGVFAGEGMWINGDGNLIDIDEMDETYKDNVIIHLFDNLYYNTESSEEE